MSYQGLLNFLIHQGHALQLLQIRLQSCLGIVMGYLQCRILYQM